MLQSSFNKNVYFCKKDVLKFTKVLCKTTHSEIGSCHFNKYHKNFLAGH